MVILAALGGFAGCAYMLHSSPAEDTTNHADGTYIGDLEARGVPTGASNGTRGAELGRAVCTDLGDGSQADNKVMQVANLQLNHMDEFTVGQAEMIVYWAVTDLCPAHASQLQQHWRDGT